MVSPSKELRNVLVLTIASFFIFSAYAGIVTLQSSLNAKDGLGVASLACLYAGYIISSIVSPIFIRLLGAKWCIVAAFITFTVYSVTNIHPTWPSLIIASFLVGFAMGPLSGARSFYIAKQAQHRTDDSSETLHSTLSRYNGIFLAIVILSQGVGTVISSVILRVGHESTREDNERISNFTYVNHTLYNESMVVYKCGRFGCPTSMNSSSLNASTSQPSQILLYILFGIFCGMGVIAIVILLFLEKLPPNEETHSDIKSTIASCFTINVRDVKIVLLAPMGVGHTMCTSILFADFTKWYVSCSIGVSMVGYVMTAYGISSFILSLTMGLVARYTGRLVQLVTTNVAQTSILIALYFWYPEREEYYILFIVSALWGFADIVMLTQATALIALAFPDNQKAAFANFYSWRAFGYTLSFALSYFLCVSTKLITTVIIQIIGFALYLGVEVMIRQQQKQDVINEKGLYSNVNSEPDTNIGSNSGHTSELC